MPKVQNLIFAVVALSATSVSAQGVDFRSAAKWQFDCVVEVPPKDYASEDRVKFTWDRRAAVGELDWSNNGVRKIMRQLNNEADYIVNFWFGPETSVIVSEGGGTVDCCYTSLLSVRNSGEFALTEHTISLGGMRAYSSQGRCTMTPIV